MKGCPEGIAVYHRRIAVGFPEHPVNKQEKNRWNPPAVIMNRSDLILLMDECRIKFSN
jgi:hypothetical protein